MTSLLPFLSFHFVKTWNLIADCHLKVSLWIKMIPRFCPNWQKRTESRSTQVCVVAYGMRTWHAFPNLWNISGATHQNYSKVRLSNWISRAWHFRKWVRSFWQTGSRLSDESSLKDISHFVISHVISSGTLWRCRYPKMGILILKHYLSSNVCLLFVFLNYTNHSQYTLAHTTLLQQTFNDQLIRFYETFFLRLIMRSKHCQICF